MIKVPYQCFINILLFIIFIYLNFTESSIITKKVELFNLKLFCTKDSTIQGYITLKKYNRTHLGCTTNFTLTDTIDKRYSFKFEAQIWGDGGWKRNLIHYSSNDPCATLKFLLGSIVEDIFVKANHSKNCPGNPGYYHFEDYFLDFSNIKILMGNGDFRILINVLFKQKTYLTLDTEAFVSDP